LGKAGAGVPNNRLVHLQRNGIIRQQRDRGKGTGRGGGNDLWRWEDRNGPRGPGKTSRGYHSVRGTSLTNKPGAEGTQSRETGSSGQKRPEGGSRGIYVHPGIRLLARTTRDLSRRKKGGGGWSDRNKIGRRFGEKSSTPGCFLKMEKLSGGTLSREKRKGKMTMSGSVILEVVAAKVVKIRTGRGFEV